MSKHIEFEARKKKKKKKKERLISNPPRIIAYLNVSLSLAS